MDLDRLTSRQWDLLSLAYMVESIRELGRQRAAEREAVIVLRFLVTGQWPEDRGAGQGLPGPWPVPATLPSDSR